MIAVSEAACGQLNWREISLQLTVPGHIELSELAVELVHSDVGQGFKKGFGSGQALGDVLENRRCLAKECSEGIGVSLGFKKLLDDEVRLAYEFPSLHECRLMLK